MHRIGVMGAQGSSSLQTLKLRQFLNANTQTGIDRLSLTTRTSHFILLSLLIL
jgi:hypothetical protein